MLLIAVAFLFIACSVDSQKCNNKAGFSGIVSLNMTEDSDSCYYFGKTTSLNPVKPCIGSSCVPCPRNIYQAVTLRVTGSWTKDAGADTLWNPAETKGLMTFDESICRYTLLVTGLRPYSYYQWKVNRKLFEIYSIKLLMNEIDLK